MIYTMYISMAFVVALRCTCVIVVVMMMMCVLPLRVNIEINLIKMGHELIGFAAYFSSIIRRCSIYFMNR